MCITLENTTLTVFSLQEHDPASTTAQASSSSAGPPTTSLST